MKIREGFVSNSSSSSFIVVWDKKPESVEEVKRILYGNMEINDLYGDGSYAVSTIDLATVIFNDTKEATDEDLIENLMDDLSYYHGTWYGNGYKPDGQLMKEWEKEADELEKEQAFYFDLLKKMTDEESIKLERNKKLSRLIGEDVPEKLTKKELQKIVWDINKRMFDNEKERQIAEDSCQKMREDFKGKFISIYHYSDNDGETVLEHGNNFQNLFHIQISHH